MPYITQDNRKQLDAEIDELIASISSLPEREIGGNLNYSITRLLRALYGQSYASMAEAVSVLEMAKLEYYRKVAAPYEDQKEFDNGSVE